MKTETKINGCLIDPDLVVEIQNWLDEQSFVQWSLGRHQSPKFEAAQNHPCLPNSSFTEIATVAWPQKVRPPSRSSRAKFPLDVRSSSGCRRVSFHPTCIGVQPSRC